MNHTPNHCCLYCKDGFYGRVLATEILEATDSVKNILHDSMPQKKLNEYFSKNKVQTLWDSAIKLVSQDLTSLEEITRHVPNNKDI